MTSAVLSPVASVMPCVAVKCATKSTLRCIYTLLAVKEARATGIHRVRGRLIN